MVMLGKSFKAEPHTSSPRKGDKNEKMAQKLI
jgi:hypothetical protein